MAHTFPDSTIQKSPHRRWLGAALKVGRHDRRAGIAKERLPLDTALFQAVAKYAAVDKD